MFSTGMPAVKVRDLRKSYGGTVAVDGVDLEIAAGEIFALVGPNGAGKTTTVEILEGYRERDGGDVSVLGCDPGPDRRLLKPRLGIVLQSTGVEPYLTVQETLEMYAGFYPHPRRVDEVISLAGLQGKARERVHRLSGGQQRRLDMAVALVGDPDLLFLDEPTTGFDPAARREAWEVIAALADLGKTILLTTHYMEEAQRLADRVAIITTGRIVAEGPPSTLGSRDRSGARIRFRLPPGVRLPAGVSEPVSANGYVELVSDDPVAELHRLTAWAIEEHRELEGLEVLRPTLEDVYLSLTEKGP